MAKRSTAIQVKSASNIRVAMNVAEEMGLPLTHFITINFGLTECPPEQAVAAFGKIRTNHFGKWVLRPAANSNRGSVPPAHIWVFENPDEIMYVHWAVHVPPGGESDFESRLPKWVERATGGTVADGALDMRPVHDVGRLALYFLKGADEAYTTYSNIRYEPQGVIEGRRFGVSRSLNRTARKKAGIRGRRGKKRAAHTRSA